ncbi:hypothetical protein FA09DRAFT_358287 [Tilletiopsis washingtonensis]|uniref:DUF1275 domain protein n=1 Tax=Tilletiopsis washingtonensis TaxID=58919 RepID=A0A316ZGP4_9BASI|nr:hypothetical protein FA09DRAFT_358287 [Tilletiopsis washingtonensis]PWO00938.1 hypothetical protein FA09DRAFT_358287 [Tilletiopsis washingtonensis]
MTVSRSAPSSPDGTLGPPVDELHRALSRASKAEEKEHDALPPPKGQSIRVHSYGSADAPPPSTPTYGSSWLAAWQDQRRFWLGAVDKEWIKWQLVFISLTTGLLDVATYTGFGVFCSYQTGNTLLVFIGLAGGPPARYIAVKSAAISLGTFLLAGLVAGQLCRLLPNGPRTRWWLFFSSMLQALPVFIPAILAHQGFFPVEQETPKPSGADQFWHMVIVLSAASGVQMSMARTVECPEIPTALLTSPYIDLLSDSHLLYPLLPRFSFQPDRHVSGAALRRKLSVRAIRLYYILAFVLGIVIAAFVRRHTRRPADILFIAGALRTLVAFSFLANRAEKADATPMGSPA